MLLWMYSFNNMKFAGFNLVQFQGQSSFLDLAGVETVIGVYGNCSGAFDRLTWSSSAHGVVDEVNRYAWNVHNVYDMDRVWWDSFLNRFSLFSSRVQKVLQVFSKLTCQNLCVVILHLLPCGWIRCKRLIDSAVNEL